MSNINSDVICEGWLTKSPPPRLWRAKWRRRWFVLEHSGELPGQYRLLYYSDRNRRKLKGTIDLDQCEQVDSGLRFEHCKQNYPHMFDVKTPKRTYYLAAESEYDMNKWVESICQVCGLKATMDDSSVEFIEENVDSVLLNETGDTESPPVSPTSSMSGPYIPISECHSGKPINTTKGLTDFNNLVLELSSKVSSKTYSNPPPQSFKANIQRTNNLKQTICADDISKSHGNKPIALPVSVERVERLNSIYEGRNILKPRREDKITNIESAKKMAAERQVVVTSDDFYDSPRKIVADEWHRPVLPASAPIPNWETFPAQEDGDFSPGDIGSWSVVEHFGRYTVVDSKLPFVTNSLHRSHKQQCRQPNTNSLRRPVAPPRPPKPSHLIIPEQPKAEEEAPLEERVEETVVQTAATDDETYDIPRSHQPPEEEAHVGAAVPSRHTYTNAAPSQVQGNVFRYDFTDQPGCVHPSTSGEPISPRSEGSGTLYYNLPSPLVNTPVSGIPTPPAVNRELKPTRKMSDSGASSEPSPGPYTPALCSFSAEPSPLGFGPPSIDRTLKPKKLLTEGAIKLARPPEGSLSMRRAGPSPTPPGSAAVTHRHSRTRSGDDDPRRSPEADQVYFYEHRSPLYAQMSLPQIKYLDLDHLESEAAAVGSGPLTTPPANGSPSITAYKTIDFVKTEAFNRTREEQEEKRKEKD